MSLSKDSLVPPTTRQVTIRRCFARRNGSHLLPPAPKKGSAPCCAARIEESGETRPRLQRRGLKESISAHRFCVFRARSYHRGWSCIIFIIFIFRHCGHCRGLRDSLHILRVLHKWQKKTPIACYKQSIWQVRTPKILSLHGKWKGSPALPDTTVQTELITCLCDRNPLPKNLRPTWALSLPSQHPHGRPSNSGDNFWVWIYLSLPYVASFVLLLWSKPQSCRLEISVFKCLNLDQNLNAFS